MIFGSRVARQKSTWKIEVLQVIDSLWLVKLMYIEKIKVKS